MNITTATKPAAPKPAGKTTIKVPNRDAYCSTNCPRHVAVSLAVRA